MKKIVLSVLTLFFLLTSCSTIKTIKLMKDGEVEQEEFSVQVPFEYRLGLIILKVNISGEEYDFLLDTGAPNVISNELAEKLEINIVTEQEVGDSQGQKSDLELAKLDKISIGGIHFLNTGAVIADLSLSNEVACLKIDGFIGSNLMRQAIWKFDYQNQIITITNSMNSFSIPELANKISFSPQLTGVPKIDLKINDVTQKNITFDLGSNGHISLSKNTYNSIVENNPSIPQTYSYGSSRSGLYGKEKVDSSYYLKVPSISFGDISLDSTIIKFSSGSSSTIGTKFFKNYDLIMNWFTEEITLIKKTEYTNSTLSSFGFSCSKEENKLIVSEVYEKLERLQIGDQILSIDETNYKELTSEQWCEIVENGLLKDKEEISITILRNNKEFTSTLRKMKLI